MLTIALAEDHLEMRRGIKNFINNIANCSVVMEAANGYELLQQLNKTKKLPDVVVMDINMPLMDGIAVTHCLQVLYPWLKVIGLSLYCNQTVVTDMIEAGAKGYVSKNNIGIYLQKALHTIYAGNIYIDESFDLNEFHFTTKENNNQSIETIVLTEKEKLFLMYCGSGLSYEQIASLLFVASDSVYNYQKHLKEKLKINSREGLMLFALQHGIAKVARLENHAA